MTQDARRAFLGELVDDAGLFPPAALSMRDALAARERALAGDAFWIVGRFVVPASRLPELAGELDDAPRPLSVSALVDAAEPLGALSALAGEARRLADRIAIEALEFPLARIDAADDDDRLRAFEGALAAAGFPEAPDRYVELGWEADPAAQAAALHRTRSRGFEVNAKIRCGGLTAAAVPAPEAVARFIWTANRLEVPFKATAGLHHPLRHPDATLGTTAHGFLNVIGGAVLTRARGLDERTLERLVADEDRMQFQLDAAAFAWSGIGANADEVAEARARFVHSYGSCSLDEPVDDLRALSMLP